MAMHSSFSVSKSFFDIDISGTERSGIVSMVEIGDGCPWNVFQ